MLHFFLNLRYCQAFQNKNLSNYLITFMYLYFDANFII